MRPRKPLGQRSQLCAISTAPRLGMKPLTELGLKLLLSWGKLKTYTTPLPYEPQTSLLLKVKWLLQLQIRLKKHSLRILLFPVSKGRQKNLKLPKKHPQTRLQQFQKWGQLPRAFSRTWLQLPCLLRELLKIRKERLLQKQITQLTRPLSFRSNWKSEPSFYNIIMIFIRDFVFLRHLLMKYAFLPSRTHLSYYLFHFYFICSTILVLNSLHLDCPLFTQEKNKVYTYF